MIGSLSQLVLLQHKLLVCSWVLFSRPRFFLFWEFSRLVTGLDPQCAHAVSAGLIPDSTTSLYFVASFTNGSESIVTDIIRASVYTLNFGDAFKNDSRPLVAGVLPNSVCALRFGDSFTNGDKPLTAVTIPASVHSQNWERMHEWEYAASDSSSAPSLSTLVVGTAFKQRWTTFSSWCIPAGVCNFYLRGFTNGYKPPAVDVSPPRICSMGFGANISNGEEPLVLTSVHCLQVDTGFTDGNTSFGPGMIP